MPEYDSSGSAHVVDPFAPAVKEQLKLRLAIDGPSGSGKTYTALIAATILAEAEQAVNPLAGGIAVADTEHDSAKLYADQFEFFHAPLAPPYSPARYIGLINAAVEHGYSVIVLDSLSHGWNAEGGVLDIVDNVAARSQGNKFAGWREGTPAQNSLIQAIVSCPIHVIATIRTAQEWVVDDVNGKKVPRKIGTKPVQRDGIEYEFTIVGDMDLEHRFVVTKSRATVLADRVVIKPGPSFFGEVVDWLNDGTPMATPAQRELIDAARAALTDDQKQEVRAWLAEHRMRYTNLTRDEAELFLDFLATLTPPCDDDASDSKSDAQENGEEQPPPVTGAGVSVHTGEKVEETSDPTAEPDADAGDGGAGDNPTAPDPPKNGKPIAQARADGDLPGTDDLPPAEDEPGTAPAQPARQRARGPQKAAGAPPAPSEATVASGAAEKGEAIAAEQREEAGGAVATLTHNPPPVPALDDQPLGKCECHKQAKTRHTHTDGSWADYCEACLPF